MDASIYNEDWKIDLHKMIETARCEGKWLFINSLATGPLWFSPDEIEAEHRNGKFMWGVGNWTLRDPRERLEAADRELAKAKAERDRVAATTPGFF